MSRLVVAHHRTQSRIADSTSAAAARILRSLLDPNDIAGSWAKIEPILVALVQQRHQVSAGVAANFVAAYRAEMGVTGRFVPAVEALRPADDIVPWLRSAIPEAVDFTGGSLSAELAQMLRGEVRGSVVRMSLDGGRDTIGLNSDRDPKCIGYRRAASAGCCAFCAMLAGRGRRGRANRQGRPLYTYATEDLAIRGGFRGDASDNDEARRYHHNCKCQPVPVYDIDDPMPPNGDMWAKKWREATRGTSGKDSLNAFRRAIDAERRAAAA